MQAEPLFAAILEAVVRAVDVPVTLKTRLGWHDDHKNLPAIARIAEDCGIAALAVHGRTRTQMYKGEAAYDLIAETKGRLKIPVWVNGDITSPQKAAAVLKQTAADGIMIGRGAQGRPWLFRDLKHYAEHGVLPPALSLAECNVTILNHIRAMHVFYGEIAGVRIARKHIGWYIEEMPDGEQTRRDINRLDSAAAQYDTLAAYLETLSEKTDRWVCDYREG